ncbi:MAG: hypothetical protein U0232_01775 [Thermomicrobiales bacterium]
MVTSGGALAGGSAGSAAAGVARDDRIYPETRWVLAIIIPFLIIAFVLLYLLPGDTDRYFAWTIRTRMTALLMGAGYITGVYFFARTILETRWHRVAVGFLAVTTFATAELIVTILHWGVFNHGYITFYGWTVLYVLSPFLVLGLWLRNRRTDPGTPDPDDVAIPVAVRWLIGVAGAAVLATGICLFLLPQRMIGIWPWMLTTGSARAVGGWLALPGVLCLGIARDSRWSAARLAVQSQALGFLLMLIGIARAWADFDQARPLTWVFIGGMVGLFLGVIALYVAMEARHRYGGHSGAVRA